LGLCGFNSGAEAAAVQTLHAVCMTLASAKRLDFRLRQTAVQRVVRFTAALRVALK
jgi:hypothetical protein